MATERAVDYSLTKGVVVDLERQAIAHERAVAALARVKARARTRARLARARTWARARTRARRLARLAAKVPVRVAHRQMMACPDPMARADYRIQALRAHRLAVYANLHPPPPTLGRRRAWEGRRNAAAYVHVRTQRRIVQEERLRGPL